MTQYKINYYEPIFTILWDKIAKFWFNDLLTRALRILSLYLNLIWSYKASRPQAIKSLSSILIFSFLYKKISCNVSPEAANGGVFCKSLGPATLLKKSLWYRCFPVNFAKSLRTHFLQNTSGRLFLSHPSILSDGNCTE